MSKEVLYKNIRNRWNASEVSVKGVLGGYENLHEADLKSSIMTLDWLKETGQINGGQALDCCAGIGRVTQNALQYYFDEIDLFDQEKNFTDYCEEFFAQNDKIDEILCCSLQEYEFIKKYDLIWVQWGFENLEDEDLTQFLLKCKDSLKEGGVIIAKENFTSLEDFYLGENYKIRSQQLIADFFENCGFEILVQESLEDEWPQELFRIITFVAKPKAYEVFL